MLTKQRQEQIIAEITRSKEEEQPLAQVKKAFLRQGGTNEEWGEIFALWEEDYGKQQKQERKLSQQNENLLFAGLIALTCAGNGIGGHLLAGSFQGTQSFFLSLYYTFALFVMEALSWLLFSFFSEEEISKLRIASFFVLSLLALFIHPAGTVVLFTVFALMIFELKLFQFALSIAALSTAGALFYFIADALTGK